MKLQLLLCAPLCVLLSSCGGDLGCGMIGMTVLPANATAGHNAAPPGNAVQFFAAPVNPGACPAPANIPVALLRPNWSVSDAVNVSISNTQDATNGTATCLNATAASVTVTATLPKSPTQNKTFVATAKLRCN